MHCFLQINQYTILYQDAFEVANPIGQAKAVHKMVAAYFSLGNLYSYHRSCVNPIQLVLLCKEKYVTSDNMAFLFQPLINDLKVLETEGLNIGLEYNVKGSSTAITGDNLGSNWMGGFVTKFSSAKYMCRYCTVESNAFSNESSEAQFNCLR